MTDTRGVSMQRIPTAGRWAIYIALAVVFAVACAFLSQWQFARNEERAAQLELVEANYDAPPVGIDEILPEGSAFDPADEWRPVRLTGTYEDSEQLLVRNRAHGGTSAFEVLVPLRLDDGRLILIDRGWEPPGNEQPLPDAVPAPPTGRVTVEARLRPGEPLPSSGRTAPDGQVATIHLPLVADTVTDGARLETGAYGLLISEDPAPASAPNTVRPPSEDPGPHLSYAIQWILFAIMGFVFIGYVIRTETRHRDEDDEDEAVARVTRPGDDSGTADEQREPARASRRRERDADVEDAILDAADRR